MLRLLIAATALFTVVPAASAQQLNYRAEIGPDGEVELVPAGDAGNAHETLDMTGDKAAQLYSDQIYIHMTADGAIKGIYADQTAAAASPLQAGETIEAFKAGTALPGLVTFGFDTDEMEKVARAAAKKLLQTAKDTACDFDPKPSTITPSVTVSFSLLAGGSITVEAEWNVVDLCP